MRICIDIDGTICELKSYIGSYDKVLPLPGVKNFIKKMREEGHTVILYTARHMKTCNGNVGLVVAKKGKELFNWLENHGIEYDEIHFGKPYADVYIDDNALKFNGNWSEISEHFVSTEENFTFNIVVTMAGAGSRFAKAGYELPKPLIPLFGKIPMYRYSTDSLPLRYANRLIFIIQKGPFSEKIKNDIYTHYSEYDVRIVEVNGLTRGQAETLALAANELNHALPTLVHNSDSAVNVDEEKLLPILKVADGVLLTFEADNDRYSFARLGNDGDVDLVREKEAISTHASTGTYYFKSTVQMLNLIQKALDENDRERGEFYIAPLYNKMINAGQRVQICPVKNYYCYGTPEELIAFEGQFSHQK